MQRYRDPALQRSLAERVRVPCPQIELLELPHVDNCSLCITCHVTEKPKPPIPASEAIHLTKEHFKPLDEHAKQTKPFCEECHGCTHSLHLLVRGQGQPGAQCARSADQTRTARKDAP